MSTALALYNGTTTDLIMQADAIGATMTPTERRMLIAERSKSLRQYPAAERIEMVKGLLVVFFRTLGITRAPDAIDGTLFYDYLVEYYPDMSVEDVKAAFELYVVGELDHYLPRDYKGKVIEPFQQFSPKFYCAVLKAFRTRQLDTKNHVSGKVSLLLAQRNVEERDPHADRAEMIVLVKGICLDIIAGRPAVFFVPAIEYALRRAKLIEGVVEPEAGDIATARSRATKGKDTAVSAAIRNVMLEGMVPEDIQIAARNLAIRRIMRARLIELGAEEVTKRFDWLIDRERSRIKK